jgi:hypothetical protein
MAGPFRVLIAATVWAILSAQKVLTVNGFTAAS